VATDRQALEALARETLPAGEEVIASVCVRYNGTVAPNRAALDSGISAVGPNPEGHAVDPDSLVSFPVANQMAIVLTGGRVLVWALGFTGKPRQFVGTAPVSAIASVESPPQQHAVGLRVVMKSGALVDLEFLKGSDGPAFTTELAALVR
jgi:hypothetical protein